MSNYQRHQPPQQSRSGGSSGFKFVIAIGLALVVTGIVVVVGYLSLRVSGPSSLATNSSSPIDKKSPPDDQRPKVTLSQYNQLKEGMAYADVVKILGMEGKLAHEKQTARDSFKSYGWKIEAARFTYIDITFKNDQLLSKTHYGLE